MIRQLLLTLSVLGAIPLSASAEDCNSSCGDQCRVNVPPPQICSPFGGCVQIGGGASFVDPQCNLKCEAFKAASCAINQPLPTVPMTPTEYLGSLGGNACTVPFQVVTQTISSQCGFAATPTADERATIEAAKNVLIKRGFFAPNDFDGTTIYWCGLTHAGGIVPDRDLVYLNGAQKGAGLRRIASLLAHEMVHVRQYRVKGTDKFKCDYVRQYSECLVGNLGKGVDCQDRNHHSVEREAYSMEDAVYANLENLSAAHEQTFSSVAIAGGQTGTKFDNPKLHGRTIDGCIKSDEFPEASNTHCSQPAQSKIANAFCAQSGKPNAVNWSAIFTGAFQHSYKYRRNASHPGEWVPDETGGYIFTSITCSG